MDKEEEEYYSNFVEKIKEEEGSKNIQVNNLIKPDKLTEEEKYYSNVVEKIEEDVSPVIQEQFNSVAEEINPNELTEEEQENQSTFGSILNDVKDFVTSKDILKAVPAGAERAVNEIGSTYGSITNFLEKKLNVGRFIWGNGESFKYIPREQVEKYIADGKLKTKDSVSLGLKNLDVINDEFESTTGSLVSAIAQFGTGFIFTAPIKLAQTASTTNKILNTMVRGSITDAIAFDPYEDNISAVLKANGWSTNIVTDYLATDQSDSEFANRMRNAGEGAIITGALELLIKGVRNLKTIRKAKEEITVKGEVSEETKKQIAKNDLETKEFIDKNITKGPKGNDFKLSGLEKLKNSTDARKDAEKKLNYKEAVEATGRVKREQDELTKSLRASKLGKEVEKELVKSFEKNSGKKISDKDGLIDNKLIRLYREETLTEVAKDKKTFVTEKGEPVSFAQSQRELIDEGIAGIEFAQEEFLTPFLREDLLDKVVATVTELAQNKETKKFFSKGKRTIDNIFNVAIRPEGKEMLLKDEQLLDVLTKTGLTFENLILATVGIGSDAGKLLRKFRDIEGMRPKNLKSRKQSEAILKNQTKIKEVFLRIENLRRGIMVSSIPTAVRNFSSAGFRVPLEGIGNIMDSVLLEISENGFQSGAKQLVSGRAFKNSMNQMKYIFRNPYSIKQFSDLLFNQEGMKKFEDDLLGQINEIRRRGGRLSSDDPSRGALEKTLSTAEDIVDLLNTPNRLQEFTVRRGVFFGELERLLYQQWNVDLFKELKKGNVLKLINNSPSFRTKGDKVDSFEEIMEKAIKKSLDVTYAKQPEFTPFRQITNFITRNGLTVIIPFPRFMFNSIELMAQYGAGASLPLTRKITDALTKRRTGEELYFKKYGKVPDLKTKKDQKIVERLELEQTKDIDARKGFTARERELIGRNFVGIAAGMAAFQWRASADAPSDYKKVPVGETMEADITPQFPLRQLLWFGENAKNIYEGGLGFWSERWNSRDFVETFLGTNVRTGVGLSIIDGLVDIAQLFSGQGDLISDERLAKAAGNAVGQYLSSWAVPIGQVVDVARGFGVVGDEYRETRNDPTLDAMETFYDSVAKPFKARGFLELFESEKETAEKNPIRQDVFAEGEARERGSPFFKLFGLNVAEKDSEDGEYLEGLGFKNFRIGSNSKVPSIRNFENKIIKQSIPLIAETAKSAERDARKKYNENENLRRVYTEKAYTSKIARAQVEQTISQIKKNISPTRKRIGAFVSENPESFLVIYNFRKLNKRQRSLALTEFVANKGKKPDLTNKEDLNTLYAITENVKQKIK